MRAARVRASSHLALALFGASGAAGRAVPAAWEPCAHLTAPEIAECSGIVGSRRFPGVFWVHNDSGDQARIFAVGAGGELLREVRLEGGRNVDWEDIATDGAGHLYIADTGNNDNKRTELVIHVIAEPDPRMGGAGPLRVPVLRSVPFFFPEQRAFPDPLDRNYDCEAIFWHAGSLYALTKHRSDTRTVLYRVPLDGEGRRAAERLGEAEIGSPVTAADVAPEGGFLAVLSYQYIHLFTCPPGDGNLLAGASHRVLIEGRQCEGICFDGERLRFANEQREIFCLDLRDLLEGDAYLPAAPEARLPRVRPRLDGRASEWRGSGRIALHPEPDPGLSHSPPSVRLGWCPEGLLVHVAWLRAAPGSETPATGERSRREARLLQLMLGPPGTAPHLEPGQRVWEATLRGDSLDMRPILPEPGPPLAGMRLRRAPGELALEMLVPTGSGALQAGGELGFNLVLFEPGEAHAGEWAWAGTSSMQPLENPLLWGRVSLDP